MAKFSEAEKLQRLEEAIFQMIVNLERDIKYENQNSRPNHSHITCMTNKRNALIHVCDCAEIMSDFAKFKEKS